MPGSLLGGCGCLQLGGDRAPQTGSPKGSAGSSVGGDGRASKVLPRRAGSSHAAKLQARGKESWASQSLEFKDSTVLGSLPARPQPSLCGMHARPAEQSGPSRGGASTLPPSDSHSGPRGAPHSFCPEAPWNGQGQSCLHHRHPQLWAWFRSDRSLYTHGVAGASGPRKPVLCS